MFRCFGIILLLSGGFSACAAPDRKSDNSAPLSDVCEASRFQDLLGQKQDSLDKTKLPEALRVIGPDMAVTADYRPDRLNVEYDDQGIITRISCF